MGLAFLRRRGLAYKNKKYVLCVCERTFSKIQKNGKKVREITTFCLAIPGFV